MGWLTVNEDPKTLVKFKNLKDEELLRLNGSLCIKLKYLVYPEDRASAYNSFNLSSKGHGCIKKDTLVQRCYGSIAWHPDGTTT